MPEKEIEKKLREMKEKIVNKIEERVYNNLKKADKIIWNLKLTIFQKEQRKY